MLTAEALAELVSDYNPKSNSVKIIEAYKYGQIKHEGQFRKSGSLILHILSLLQKFWLSNA
jgi:(p)ppGpp synthase/HD superfamily hydrolase